MKKSIIVWYQIFGSLREYFHWSNLASKQDFVEPFSRDQTLDITGFTLEEWSKYHGTLKHLRDKFLIHVDMDSFIARIPRIDKALQITEAYRDWLYGMILEAIKSNAIKTGFDRTEKYNKRVESEWKP